MKDSYNIMEIKYPYKIFSSGNVMFLETLPSLNPAFNEDNYKKSEDNPFNSDILYKTKIYKELRIT